MNEVATNGKAWRVEPDPDSENHALLLTEDRSKIGTLPKWLSKALADAHNSSVSSLEKRNEHLEEMLKESVGELGSRLLGLERRNRELEAVLLDARRYINGSCSWDNIYARIDAVLERGRNENENVSNHGG